MNQEIVADLLVAPDVAIKRVQIRLELIDVVKEGRLDRVTWYDETVNELDAVFASKASQYFADEGGFRFSYVMNQGRTLKSANLDRTEGILKRIIDAIGAVKKPPRPSPAMEPSDRVFVVHGHDEAKLLEVKAILKSQNLMPVVLKSEPNGGRTVIEKFEENSDVGFAVILLTADDVGATKLIPDKLSVRARQNVILELGYFIGRLTRSRICALNESGVELPSDIHGLVYTTLDAGGAWRYNLLDELKHAGYEIDKNNLE